MSHSNVRAVLTALVLLAGTRGAHAQSEQEIAARRLLLEQAQAARSAGDHGRALDAALRAGRIQMTPSVRLFIAEEQQQVGQLAAALGTAELCVRETERDTTVRNRAAILNSCRAIATQLRPRVGLVTVRVPSPAPPGLRVTVGGNVLNEALYGVPYVVDPGTVVIEATAADRTPFRQEVSVAAGQTLDVNVDLAVAPTPPRETTITTTTGTVASTTQTPSGSAGSQGTGGLVTTGPGPGPIDVQPPRRGPGVGPYLVMGAGAATLGASLVFFLLRNGAIGDCVVEEPNLVCPNEESRMRALDAPTYNTLTNVTLGVGIAAVAGGALWWALSPRSGGTSGRAALHVAPLAGGAYLGIHGGF
jgi:hypothetical protein